MKKTMILLVLMMAMMLSGGYFDARDNFDGSHTTLTKPSNQESNSTIDEIIKYYKLFKQIETLDARIDSLEKKVEVLEKAVEYETFDGNYEEYLKWNRLNTDLMNVKDETARDIITKELMRTVKKRNSNTITKKMNDNYDSVMEEISDIWEAIDEINRRLK